MTVQEVPLRSHPPCHAPVRGHRFYTPRILALALGGVAMLGGCQHNPARQDSYTTPLSTCAYMMPTVSGTRTYTPARTGTPGSSALPSNPVDSAVAYSNPQTPAFCDRPLSDTLRSSIELADYTHLLDSTGLFPTLQQAGPFTVFALPNAALETHNARTAGQLLDPANAPTVRNMLGYTIVLGQWPHKALRAAVNAAPGHSVLLPTLNGQSLAVWLDPQTEQIMVGPPHGWSSPLWVMGIPQSNGVLYFTRALVLPPQDRPAPSPSTPTP